MVQSAVQTAADPERVEVVAVRDVNDQDLYRNMPGVTYHRVPRPMRNGMLYMSGLWQRAWDLGHGDVGMLCADDVVFETPGWDEHVRDVFRSVPDRIVMVCTRNGQDDRPVLPFVSREWIDLAGFTPDHLAGWFADEWIWSMAAEIGRVVFLDDVMIRHNQFGADATYIDAQRTREAQGGLQGMRNIFYSIPEVARRDEMTKKLIDARDPDLKLIPDPAPRWFNDSLWLNMQARQHERMIQHETLIVVHCYKGDRDVIKRHMPLYEHHYGAPVLVLSPENAPVSLKGHECRTAGQAGYYGQVSLDRQRAHLQMLLEYPQKYFLLNDADSFCISPTIPRYLYDQSPGVVWSNEVVEWREHWSPYPKIAMQPPYFLTRDSIARMLSVADRPEVRAHPITPFIDWYMLALTCEAGLQHRSFPDGASFPAWRRGWIAETTQLGQNPVHKNDPKGDIRGDLMMQKQVELGKVMLHSVKHREVMEMLVETHAKYVRRGSPPVNTMTIEQYVEQREFDTRIREQIGGTGFGERITI